MSDIFKLLVGVGLELFKGVAEFLVKHVKTCNVFFVAGNVSFKLVNLAIEFSHIFFEFGNIDF